MCEVVGVRFKPAGKIYYFSPDGQTFSRGENVIVETARGIEYGTIVLENCEKPEEEIQGELKKVIRHATPEDDDKHIDNKNRAREALIICADKIKEHGLEMRLLASEYTFDNSKLLFYFTAEGRVDFRMLVRDLASIFRTRIELRQIGVRDEAKILGGLGSCGRKCCCCTFLTEFSPVTIKMAKDQGLSLNPANISGICGRLMCCLHYEEEGYEAIRRRMPQVGEIVYTEFGEGIVTNIYMVQELIKVRIEEDDEYEFYVIGLDDVKRTHRIAKLDHSDDEDEDYDEES